MVTRASTGRRAPARSRWLVESAPIRIPSSPSPARSPRGDGPDCRRGTRGRPGGRPTRPRARNRDPDRGVPSGLAASTLLHGPFSGDGDAAAALVAELETAEGADHAAGDSAGSGEEFDRRLASLVTIDTVAAAGATERASRAVERALRPYRTPDAPFDTLGGYADVLDAVARTAPAAGISLALGERAAGNEDVRDAALAAWRKYGTAVHEALQTAATARHHGVWVLELGDADAAILPAVARLARDFRAPEPVALAVADGAAAAAGESGIGDAVATAASAVDGTGHGTDDAGWARFDTETEQFTDAFREAL
ncbi:hypothetical protein SY89_01853 [Halolamina pelagica]|uniref:Uncharacterized protein n=1 Tax=Halolamina pelagica TaxID=699431 RepID=A0A0P7GZL9_9EURY|nr:hypothetical protein [Halolamina pelagica]KPN31110.1 hypothetical protein SY89_01853 [Halolamina pelagica]